jgi:hypothetical protein
LAFFIFNKNFYPFSLTAPLYLIEQYCQYHSMLLWALPFWAQTNFFQRRKTKMIKVAIKNLRKSKPKHPWQVRVDRASILGNPYHMVDESQRDKVCNQYEEYFNENMKYPDTAFYNEIERLYGIMKEYGKLELYCWCAPKRCHAETIKAYLEARQPVYDLEELLGEVQDMIEERRAIEGSYFY